MTLELYILGYFIALIGIFLSNKYLIVEDWLNDIKKISIEKALLLSVLSWLFVIGIVIAAILIYIGESSIYKKLNAFFESR